MNRKVPTYLSLDCHDPQGGSRNDKAAEPVTNSSRGSWQTVIFRRSPPGRDFGVGGHYVGEGRPATLDHSLP